MDTQKERSRLDEDNLSDKQTDVTRSENQQRSQNANEGDNVANNATSGGDGHSGGNETGGHQEGMYEKNHPQQTVDNQKPTP